MLNTDILERERWRVTEDDSKEEKSRTEVGNCVKNALFSWHFAIRQTEKCNL